MTFEPCLRCSDQRTIMVSKKCSKGCALSMGFPVHPACSECGGHGVVPTVIECPDCSYWKDDSDVQVQRGAVSGSVSPIKSRVNYE